MMASGGIEPDSKPVSVLATCEMKDLCTSATCSQRDALIPGHAGGQGARDRGAGQIPDRSDHKLVLIAHVTYRRHRSSLRPLELSL